MTLQLHVDTIMPVMMQCYRDGANESRELESESPERAPPKTESDSEVPQLQNSTEKNLIDSED